MPLAPLTTLGIGGPAQWFMRAATADDVAAAHRWCRDRSLPLFPLGDGSNLVIADAGIPGLVLQIAIAGTLFAPRRSETVVRVGAGEPWDRTVEATVSHGLAGLECLSGIPGRTGATPIQNVGAYGQEVSNTLVDLTAFDTATGRLVTLSADECGFGYRTSRFKQRDAGRFVVCDVGFALRYGPPTLVYPDVIRYLQGAAVSSPTLNDVRQAVLAIRRTKGMVIDEADPDTRSVGSFFTNPVVSAGVHADLADRAGGPVPGFPMPGGQVKIPAAWLIEQSGLGRGYGRGRVGLSSKHPLAIINRGGATARDLLDLAVLIKRRVEDRFGIGLVPEPVFAGFGDDADVAYLVERRL
ncbi:MAG: UDP-N-acetylmuramate dehydrogenase [Acidobacteria bacterium]|nr:UDP-N-acetylmuramate dehydrogenase [Acidobacteriota bacterium]